VFAAIAIIVAIGIAIYAVVKHMNAWKQEAKDNAQAQAELNDKMQQSADEIENLKSEISDLVNTYND